MARRIAHISRVDQPWFSKLFLSWLHPTAVTVNVPHALNEQAKHVAHILQTARDLGTPTVEPTAQAEEDYVQEIAKSANVGARFYAECTPGYYNSEGKRENRSGFFSDMHSAGAIKFFKILKDWRDEGSLEAWTYAKTAPLGSFKVARLQPNMQRLVSNDIYCRSYIRLRSKL